MNSLRLFPFLLAALLAALPAPLPAAPAGRHAALARAIEDFLLRQSAGLAGEVSVTVGNIDERRELDCTTPEFFLPPGSRAWGRTTVGVRCAAPAPWTIYVAASVKVQGTYLTAALPLAQGQVLGAADLGSARGDLTSLPPGILTAPEQAIGQVAAHAVRAGAPLRRELLRAPQAVASGQVVRLVSSGSGFSVSAEGRALANAAVGQVVQARTASGQVVSGVARAGGVVEVGY